jgi:hypothetical protein
VTQKEQQQQQKQELVAVQAQLLRQHAAAHEYEVESIAQTEALAALALQVTRCVLVLLVQYYAVLQPSSAILAST